MVEILGVSMGMEAQKGRRGTTVKTPTVLKLIEGRGQGRDSGGRPVKPAPGFKRLPPSPPPIITGEALDEWHRVVAELSRLGVLKQIDGAGLAAYCLAWQRLVEAQKLVAEAGLLAETSQGLGRHPAVAVAEAASKELRAWAHEFGLTPSAEANLVVPESSGDGDDNPFDPGNNGD